MPWCRTGKRVVAHSMLMASPPTAKAKVVRVVSMALKNWIDPLFDQAVQFVTEKRKASISGVQRQFRIGYNRAARIIEQMEAQGIVSEQGHNGNREVLAPPPFD